MLLEKRIPLSYVLGKIKYDLVLVLLIGTAVYFIKHWFRYWLPVIPIAIPAFIGTAISVILSFKLNQSYDRWWEARKLWGSIVNDSRNFVLQLISFLPATAQEDLRTIARRQIAWCHCLWRSLRGHEPLAGLKPFLSTAELVRLDGQANKPLAILQLNAEHLAALRMAKHLDAYSHVQVNTTLGNLCAHMGMAERIKSTVFPVTYRLFLHLFIYLFIITLSIALEDTELYYELPLLTVISSSFLLLEKSAKHLQDPFSDLPTDTAMTAIATTIEINLKQMLVMDNVPEPQKAEGFYVM